MKNKIKALAISILAGATMLTASTSSPRPLTGNELVEKVRHELVMLPYYNVFDNLAYRVDGDTVRLYGQVTRPILKSDAENVVKRIPGVTHLNSQIEVLPLSPFDNQVRRSVFRAIYSQSSLSRYALGVVPGIHIIVRNGNVTLEGVVANEMDRNIAGIRANGVFGVFSVTNNLQVASKHS